MAFTDSFAKAQRLNGISLISFVASISVSCLIFAIEILVFFTIRTRLPEIYFSESTSNAIVSANLKGHSISNLVRFDCNDGHLDRYFFRRYVRTLFLIFSIAALVIPPVLFPLNYIHGKAGPLGVSGLDTLGWSNVGLDHTDRYWAHLLFGLLFISLVSWMVWAELTHYVEIRQRSPSATLCTVLIDSIPDDWMAEKDLRFQFEAFPGEITHISVNRDYRVLSQAVAECERLSRSLEMAETKYIRRAIETGIYKPAKRSIRFRDRIPLFSLQDTRALAAWLRCEAVDPVPFYREELRKMSQKVKADREILENFPQLHSAFITFKDPIAAHIVCQAVIHTAPGYMTPRVLPVSGDDIVWDNVCIPWWNRNIRVVTSNVLITVVAILCVIPTAFIGLLSQIVYVIQAVEWLNWMNELPKWSLGLLQGVLSPVLLAILVKGFATVLEYLVRKQGISTRSNIDLKIQDFYFYFLLVQTTLVVSLSAGFATIADKVEMGSIAATLATNLPKASNYFISHILVQGLSISANSLLRIDRLTENYLLAPIFDKTVTQMTMRQRDRDIEWGTFVPFYTNLTCIGFLYAVISPIILPLQALIFMLFWVVHSRSTVLPTARDNGGLFYPKALKHLVIGLYLMESSLLGLFLLVRDPHGKATCVGQACLMALATALTAVYHRILCRAFNPLLYFTPVAVKPMLAKDHVPFSVFHHEALKSTPVIRLPRDDRGVSSIEVVRMRKELPWIAVSDEGATIDATGHIRLETT